MKIKHKVLIALLIVFLSYNYWWKSNKESILEISERRNFKTNNFIKVYE